MKRLKNSICAIRIIIALFSIAGIKNLHATAISITPLTGSQSLGYIIGTPAPLPFTLVGNFSNDQKLYVWDEVQNFMLPGNLYVDRVANISADFIGGTSGNYFIKAGTIVSSHYVQWDPNPTKIVKATLEFDSDIFAFITADQKLFNSDSWLGLPGINYGDFTYRGLETGDITTFNGGKVDINWSASNPGDWTRLITAYSPTAAIPEPASILLFGFGFAGFISFKKKSYLDNLYWRKAQIML